MTSEGLLNSIRVNKFYYNILYKIWRFWMVACSCACNRAGSPAHSTKRFLANQRRGYRMQYGSSYGNKGKREIWKQKAEWLTAGLLCLTKKVFSSSQIALAYGSCNFEDFQNITRAHKSRNALAFVRFSILTYDKGQEKCKWKKDNIEKTPHGEEKPPRPW